MNTRRKFITNGTMAAAALLVAKPFKAIAGNTSFSLLNNTQNHLVFIHTAGLETATHASTLNFIGAIRNKTSNAIVLNTVEGNTSPALVFDASVNDTVNVSELGGYRIITKGGIRTGIITINKQLDGLVAQIDTLAAMLKIEKKCKIVICMSQLGYSHKTQLDDQQLAAHSSQVDIIIGAHPTNFTKHPIVLHNSQKQEVILQSASSSASSLGKIEIGFDSNGNKNHVHILAKVPKKEGQQTAIIAA